MYEDILLQIRRPGQYIGNEWNVSRNDFQDAQIRCAICFPDLYEIGMSNLGIRVIYGLLNKISGVTCERFFSPASDMEVILRGQGRGLLSLESARGMREFDIVGFSLAHELNYTNVLNLLELGGLPLRSCERGNTHPLVIGGGPCVLNPEPMADFFDLFLIGEAEEALPEIIEIYRGLKDKFKAGDLDRRQMLLALSAVEGVYVPSLYAVSYAADGGVAEFRPLDNGLSYPLKKRIVRDFDAAHFPCEWLVPFTQIVHDRLTMEIMRGCPNTCRFCQARQQYYPVRVRNREVVFNAAVKAYQLSGYEEISLAGLSVSDYPGIEELARQMVEYFRRKAVGISLPSIKPHDLVGGLSWLLASIKKTGLTFAPEAGTARMRQVIAKDFDEENFFRVLESAYRAGYQHVKLYFMTGLPFENQQDLDGIVDFAVRVSYLRRKVSGYPAQVNLSINALIPKPHTSLQWFAMDDMQTVKEKHGYLAGKMARNRRIKFNFHNRQMSFLEGVFSRGDRRLAQVIFSAFKAGARFDAWEDHFILDRWLEAFKGAGIDPLFYLRGRQRQEFLPWDFLDIGMNKDALLRELDKIIDIK